MPVYTVVGWDMFARQDTHDMVEAENGEAACRAVWHVQNRRRLVWRVVVAFSGLRRYDADAAALARVRALGDTAPRAPIGKPPAPRTVVGFWHDNAESVCFHERTILAVEGLMLAEERLMAATKRLQARGQGDELKDPPFRVQFVYPGHIAAVITNESLGEDWPE